jgi:hypothetical protein
MTNTIRSLSDAELDLVSGGLDGWVTCDNGTTSGGGPGLYPAGADCSGPNTLIDGVLKFYKAATGKDLTL